MTNTNNWNWKQPISKEIFERKYNLMQEDSIETIFHGVAKEIASDAIESMRKKNPGFIEKFEDRKQHKLSNKEMEILEDFLMRFCNKNAAEWMDEEGIEYEDVLDAVLDYLETGGNPKNW